MILGLKDYNRYVIDIQKYDPSLALIPTIDIMNNLMGINFIDIYECYPVYFVMKKLLKDFLYNNDFGLLYPDRPPSKENILFWDHVPKIIANVGVDNKSDDENITLKLLEIYFIYNQTDDFQTIINYFQYEKNFDRLWY
jgi:hypothetical protein